MMPRRPPWTPVGTGPVDVPYDQSGGSIMPGMELPQPGGSMKKMSLEFNDAAEAQQPQIPEGAGVPPAGAQGAIPPAGMQTPPEQSMSPMLSQAVAPSSDLFSDSDLQSIVGPDFSPEDIEGEQMSGALLDQGTPMPMRNQYQMQLMEAARRRLGGAF